MLSGSIAAVEEERVLRLTDGEEAEAFPFPFADDRTDVEVDGCLFEAAPIGRGSGVDSRRGGAEADREGTVTGAVKPRGFSFR